MTPLRPIQSQLQRQQPKRQVKRTPTGIYLPGTVGKEEKEQLPPDLCSRCGTPFTGKKTRIRMKSGLLFCLSCNDYRMKLEKENALGDLPERKLVKHKRRKKK